jgi:hypothetical protein
VFLLIKNRPLLDIDVEVSTQKKAGEDDRFIVVFPFQNVMSVFRSVVSAVAYGTYGVSTPMLFLASDANSAAFDTLARVESFFHTATESGTWPTVSATAFTFPLAFNATPSVPEVLINTGASVPESFKISCRVALLAAIKIVLFPDVSG